MEERPAVRSMKVREQWDVAPSYAAPDLRQTPLL
jgi:hypothetical protein